MKKTNVSSEVLILPKKLEKCASRAHPFWAPKRTPKRVQEQPKTGSLFGVIFGPILGSLLEVFWVPSGPQDWPGRGLEEPKRAKWSSEKPKRRLSKKWFSHGTVCIFSLLRPPKTAPRGLEDCQRASRGSLAA